MANESKKYNLVIIDGPSGTGKDTLLKSIADSLEARRGHFLHLSEDELDPNRDAIKKARDEGKQKGGTGDLEMATVITTHRAQIYKQILTPLNNNVYPTTVLANRGVPATLAYQTLRKEITMSKVWNDHQRHCIPVPDLVVITNCRPETAQKREDSRNTVSQGLSGSVTKEAGSSASEVFRRRQALHQNFRRVAEFLRGKSLPVIELDTEYLTLKEETDIVLRNI